MTILRSLKSVIRSALSASVDVVGRTRLGRLVFDRMIDDVMGRTGEVTHNGVRLVFAVPNSLNQFRVDTFASKEPETLRWIDEFPTGSVLWDIGANIGLYTCYAAKARQCRVFAFEPSVFNLELLARNVFLNGLADRATIVPLPLAGGKGVNRMRMSSTQWGGALSTFGETYGFDGNTLASVFEFQTVGLSMTEACTLLAIPRPDFVKMDVDGIEHLILSGGAEILRGARGVLVEINENFREQADSAGRLLAEAGLTFRNKHRWIEAAETKDSPFSATYNQIWWRQARS